MLFVMLASCGGQPGEPISNDTILKPDSMPVVDPGIIDTSRIINPPPTNDDINVYPDTSKTKVK